MPLPDLQQEHSLSHQLCRTYVRCGVNKRAPLVSSVRNIMHTFLWQTRRRLPAAEWLDGVQHCLCTWRAVGVPEIVHKAPATTHYVRTTGNAEMGTHILDENRLARTIAAIQPGFRAIVASMPALIIEIWTASEQDVAKVRLICQGCPEGVHDRAHEYNIIVQTCEVR
jgi:hypothetical protein